MQGDERHPLREIVTSANEDVAEASERCPGQGLGEEIGDLFSAGNVNRLEHLSLCEITDVRGNIQEMFRLLEVHRVRGLSDSGRRVGAHDSGTDLL